MNVLYLCTFYHEVFLFRDLLNNVEKQNHYNIDVFNGVKFGTVVDKKYLPIMDDKIMQAECYGNLDRYLLGRKRKKYIQTLTKNVNIEKYDFIHAHSLITGGHAAMASTQNNDVKYIVSIRNTDVNIHLKIPGMKSLAKKIIHRAIGVHFLSETYKKQFIQDFIPESEKNEFEAKTIVIPNGVEDYWLEHLYYRPTNIKNNNPKTIKFLFAGVINKNKNVTKILKVCDELICQGYNVQLTVVGKNADVSVYNLLSSKKYVNIHKFMTKEELISLYRENDIFLMPSKNETFGRVYVEAMSQGMPVIYTRGQGFDGQFDDGVVGYSVACNDSHEMAECAKKIMQNYDSISLCCTENAKLFSWEEVGKRFDVFYKKCLKQFKIDGK